LVNQGVPRHVTTEVFHGTTLNVNKPETTTTTATDQGPPCRYARDLGLIPTHQTKSRRIPRNRYAWSFAIRYCFSESCPCRRSDTTFLCGFPNAFSRKKSLGVSIRCPTLTMMTHGMDDRHQVAFCHSVLTPMPRLTQPCTKIRIAQPAWFPPGKYTPKRFACRLGLSFATTTHTISHVVPANLFCHRKRWNRLQQPLSGGKQCLLQFWAFSLLSSLRNPLVRLIPALYL